MLREQINTPLLYRAVKPLFAAVLIGGFLLALFFNADSTQHLVWYWLLPAVFFTTGLVFISIWYGMHGKVPGRSQERVLAILLLLILLSQLCVSALMLQMQTDGNGMFGEVYTAAAAFVNEGVLPGHYLALNSGYDGVYALLCGVFFLVHLFGIDDYVVASLALNVAALFLGVLLTYFSARLLFGVNQALLLLLWACAFSPFLLLQAPLVQGASLALVCVAGGVLLWLTVRKQWREGAFKKALISLCVCALFLALGFLLERMVLVLFCAVLLDLIFLLCGRGRVWLFLSAFAVFVLVVVGSKLFLYTGPLLSHYDINEKMPPVAALMVGLSSWGTENTQDSAALQEAEGYAARQDLIYSEIQTRIKNLGPLGVLQLLGTKMSVLFSDGTLGASDVLGEHAVSTGSVLQELVLPRGTLNYVFVYVAFSLWGSLLVWVMVATVRSFLLKNDALTFMRMALLLAVVVGLVLVARPQYFVCLLPLLWLCALEMCQSKRGADTENNRQNAEQEQENETRHKAQEPAIQSGELCERVDYMDPGFCWKEQKEKLQTERNRPE